MSIKKIKNINTIRKKIKEEKKRLNSESNKETMKEILNNICDRLHKMGYKAQPIIRHKYWWKWKIDTNAPKSLKPDMMEEYNTFVEGVMGYYRDMIQNIKGLQGGTS